MKETIDKKIERLLDDEKIMDMLCIAFQEQLNNQ